MNTPEKGRPCYEEATDRNRELAGESILLVFDHRHKDKHGRLLAYAFTPEGRSIDAQLVAEGLSRAWKRDGRFHKTLARIEDGARAAKKGCLWKESERKKAA